MSYVEALATELEQRGETKAAMVLRAWREVLIDLSIHDFTSKVGCRRGQISASTAIRMGEQLAKKGGA